MQEVVLIETKLFLGNFPDIFKEANLQEHISGFTITTIHFNLFALSLFLLIVLHGVWFQQNEPKIVTVWNNYERAVEIVRRSTVYTFSVSFPLQKQRPEVFCKKGVLRNFTKVTGKQLCLSLFLNKVAGLRLWHKCFPVNFVKFLRTPLVAASDATLNGFGCWYCSCMYQINGFDWKQFT